MTLVILSVFFYKIHKEEQRERLANKYNSVLINYKNTDQAKTILLMKEIINKKDITYSPLALYFLIDNNLIDDKDEINILFDILLKKTDLEDEIINLIIYKKALFNSNLINENELIQMLSPIINSESIWKSHSLYLVAEYFYSNGEKQKAKEFFSKILLLPNSNRDILKETQKRMSRDLSD